MPSMPVHVVIEQLSYYGLIMDSIWERRTTSKSSPFGRRVIMCPLSWSPPE